MTQASPGPETDKNLLFGVLALEASLISGTQFIEACALWANQDSVSLPELMDSKGWIIAADRANVERLVERRLARTQETEDPERRPTVTAVMNADSAASQSSFSLADGVEYGSPSSSVSARERYTLHRIHARGGIGQVWIARDRTLGRNVALKELRPEQAKNPSILGRFLEEARIAGQLEHPGIVPVYEMVAGAPAETPFYTMRFVHGKTFSGAIQEYHAKRQRGEATTVEQLTLLTSFVAVCNALAYAHSRGVVHRDIKGHNIILGDYGEVILLDWGLAKLVPAGSPVTDAAALNANPTLPIGDGFCTADETQILPAPMADEGLAIAAVRVGESQIEAIDVTHTRVQTVQGQVMGTPAYMAPEQAAGRTDWIDARTDVYGLGALLYELLTGVAPFCGESVVAVLRLVLESAPRTPRQIVTTVPAPLDAICLKALAKSRSNRYQSASALAGDIQNWLADEPVSAYPEPWPIRTGRWVRRHRTAVVGSAAALLMAAVSLLILTVALASANQREREAKELALRNEQIAQTQRDEAKLQRDKAQTRYSLARLAVDRYQALSESSELKAHGLESLRSRLLEAALDFYKQFLRDETGDINVQADRGRTFTRLANLYRVIGRNESAEQGYLEALATQKRLVSENPEVSEYSHDLAKTYANLGTLYSATGRRDAAEASYLKALDIQRKLTERHPTGRTYQQALATSYMILGNLYYQSQRFTQAESTFHEALRVQVRLVDDVPNDLASQEELGSIQNSLGNVYSETNRTEAAEAAYRSALAIQEKLASAQPNSPDHLQRLAGTHNNLGLWYRSKNRLVQAEESVKQGLAIQQKLAESHPDVIAYITDLGSSYCNLGHVVRDSGHPDSALAWYDLALRALNEVLKKEPRDTTSKRFLRSAHWGRAASLARLNRHAESIADWDQAIALDDGQMRAAFQSMRAESLAHTPNYRAAIADVKALGKNPPPGNNAFYNLACVCGVAAATAAKDEKQPAAVRAELSGKYAAEAMELLRRAAAAGLFKNPAALEYLKNDADLATVRKLAEYSSWLKSIETAPP